MKFTKYNLKKLETVFEELEYDVIYEKGSFQSGYCIVEGEKMVVINKFFETEARINCLLEILDQIVFAKDFLSRKSQRFLFDISRSKQQLPASPN